MMDLAFPSLSFFQTSIRTSDTTKIKISFSPFPHFFIRPKITFNIMDSHTDLLTLFLESMEHGI